MIDKMLIRGAKVHNLKNIDVDIPLGKIVGIAGVSGSGKSSLALGVLYAEGSRRYLEALSTYTRRRMTQASRASVDEVLYVPAALALHQRPGVPGIRSTFGTGTELLNSLRLMYSRLASHRCPNGHYLAPSLLVAAGKELVCPACGVHFYAPSAEELAFNSQGACQKCGGTGMVHTVDMATLVPDESLTIDEGAVAPWNSLMWSLMTDICREMGVRTDVPFRELTEREKNIVFHGPAEKKHIFYHNKNTGQAGDLDFTYFNAVYTVENALSKVKDEKGMKRVEKFLKEDVCPDCHGTRLSSAARAPRLRGISLDEACTMSLTQLVEWVKSVPSGLPEEMRPMAESICEAFQSTAKRLMDLGLGYLTLDRSASTLSTGERQRMQLARAVRNRTTGVLYVLDEPSIGLHPSNIVGLTGVMHDLVADGNSVILVDHDTQILKEADWIVEMGPEAGAKGGYVIAQGAIPAIEANSASQIGPFLAGTAETKLRCCTEKETLFANGTIHLSTDSDPYRQAAGGGYPQGPPHRRDRRVRLRQDDHGAREPDPRAGGNHRWQRTASAYPHRFGRRHRACQAHRRRRRLASTSARRWRPMRARMTSCASSMPNLRTRRRAAIRQAISPTIPAPCVAPAATAPASSVWTCSSCRMWTFPVRTAVAPAMPERPDAVPPDERRGGAVLRLPELMDMDVNSALEFCRDRKTVSQRAGRSPAAGPRLPDPGRGNAEPVRRRGTAAQARQRDRQDADGLRLCL